MSKTYQSLSMGYLIIGSITVVTIGLIIALAVINSPPSLSSKTNREVALMCAKGMATKFHIHPVLKIIINGQPQEIPTNIGVTPSCMDSLHTHDNGGTIHVESPEKRDFTLGDFFAVWNQPFSKNQILNYQTDSTHTIAEMVNGKEVQDYKNTVLHDKDEMVIDYEKTPTLKK